MRSSLDSFVAARVRFARHPHPSPFAPSPPVGALASRSVGFPWVPDRPRFLIALCAVLGWGWAPLPPPAGARLPLSFPPPRSPRCFNTLAVPIAMPSSSLGSIIALGHDTLGASLRLPGAGSKLPRPWLLPSALPAPGTRALAGRPVPPRATRHAAGYARRSRYARHIGSGLRPPFLSAGALFCGSFVLWFPLSRRLARFAHNPKDPNARPIPSFCGGACRPHPPLYYYRRAVGGAAPVNPCPRNARGGAVFFMVSCRFAAVGSRARRSCPHSSIKLP